MPPLCHSLPLSSEMLRISSQLISHHTVPSRTSFALTYNLMLAVDNRFFFSPFNKFLFHLNFPYFSSIFSNKKNNNKRMNERRQKSEAKEIFPYRIFNNKCETAFWNEKQKRLLWKMSPKRIMKGDEGKSCMYDYALYTSLYTTSLYVFSQRVLFVCMHLMYE